jgi:hypothetical protein
MVMSSGIAPAEDAAMIARPERESVMAYEIVQPPFTLEFPNSPQVK